MEYTRWVNQIKSDTEQPKFNSILIKIYLIDIDF